MRTLENVAFFSFIGLVVIALFGGLAMTAKVLNEGFPVRVETSCK